jgi:hypothetical protein
MNREEIETQIQDLRRQRGFALLHKKKFDDSALTELQRQLDCLADIEAAKAAQANEESAKAAEAEIAATKTEIEQLKLASAEALASSRGAYAQAADAMRTHLETEASLRKAQAINNHPSKFGVLAWPMTLAEW